MATLTKQTGISFALAIPLLLMCLWIERRLAKIEFQLTTIQRDINNPWDAVDQAHWVELLKISNPGLTIPLPKPRPKASE